MASEGFGLFLDPKTINDANASRRNTLSVPTADENDTLYVKSDTNRKWREHLEVKDTKLAPWPDDPAVVAVTVQYKVTSDHYQKNAGRVMTKTYFLNLDAIKTGQSHESYKKTMMNLGKLNQLIRACGLELETDDNGKIPYGTYFNDDKPLVGTRFWGVIRDYVWTNKDGIPQPDQDVDNFIKESA